MTVTRLYGFADAVELSVAVPAGAAGLSAANAAVAQAATQATLAAQAAADAKPGEYTLMLSANLKQNARPLKVDVPLRVKVLPP